MNKWPFAKEAFVWAMGSSGSRVSERLAALSIPVVLFQGGNGKAADFGGVVTEAVGLVRVAQGEEILGIEGHLGQFQVRIRQESGGVTEYEAGFVLVCREKPFSVAQGSGVALPEVNTLTIDELEALAASERSEATPESIALWLDPVEGLPDRVLAERALRALLCLKNNGKPDCYVLCRNVPLWGLDGQSLYDDLRDKGVRFLRLDGDRPQPKTAEGRVELEVLDRTLSDRPVRLRLDKVLFVGQPSPPPGAVEAARCAGDPLDVEGFLQKDNVHLYPSRSFRKGIYYIGSSKGEQAEEELAEELEAILPEILAPIASGEVQGPEGIRIERGHCVSCLTCYRVCPHHAIDISKGPVPVPVDPACYGCGLCAALCPGNAIELVKRPGREILGELQERVGTGAEGTPRAVVFCCSRSGFRLREAGGLEDLSLPPRTSLVEVPCACSVSEEMLLAAFLKGAEKVVVVGCHPDNCVSQRGSSVGEKRVQRVGHILAAGGKDPLGCVRFVAAAPNESHRLSHILRSLDPDRPGPAGLGASASSEGEAP